MECLVIGLGVFGRAVAKNLKEHGSTVVGIDVDERALQESESFLDEALKLDTSLEDNLRHIGVENFHHCFICIGSSMEASLTTALNLTNLGVSKLTARSNSSAHSLLLQKIGSIHVVSPEMEIAKQMVKEILTDVENYIRIRDDMIILTVPTPDLMVYKNLRELSLRRKYHIQILWMDKFTPYIDGQGKEGVYEENVDFIPLDYRFNAFDRISVFGNMKDIQTFIQDMSSENLSDVVVDTNDETE